MNLEQFWQEQSKWSQATFGTDAERGPTGPLKHLAKEVLIELLGARLFKVNPLLDELTPDPADLKKLEEYVDLQFLIFDSCRRAGFTFEQLVTGCFHKLEINKNRKWGKASATEAVEHVRE